MIRWGACVGHLHGQLGCPLEGVADVVVQGHQVDGQAHGGEGSIRGLEVSLEAGGVSESQDGLLDLNLRDAQLL